MRNPYRGENKGGTWYKPGSWNIQCDRTGFKVKADRTEKEWNNLIVRKESYEPRQPQDLLRSHPDRQQVPDPRTEGTWVFLGDNDVSVDDL